MVMKDIENILSKNVKIFSYEVKLTYVILFIVFMFVACGCTIKCSSNVCLGDFKGLLSNTKEYMTEQKRNKNESPDNISAQRALQNLQNM